jgi:hypothetical protein
MGTGAATGRATASSATDLRARGNAGGPSLAEEDFERPYKRLYNESLDPFADFSRREKARQYQALTSAEKITLNSSRLVLSNKLARNFLFFYMLVMHILVFATLWHFAHVQHGCGEEHTHGNEALAVESPAAAAAAAGVAHNLPAGMARAMPGFLQASAAAAEGSVLGS